MPTITQIKYILAVDRHRHFGEAARASSVSQPSLSMQIQKAEEELGVVLVDRTQKPIMRTEKGTAVIEQAKIIFEEHQKLLTIGSESSNKIKGSIRIGIIPTLTPYIVPLFIEDFATTYPEVSLVIDELKTEDIVKGLREDQLDGAILVTPLGEVGLRERFLFSEPFLYYGNPEFELTKRKSVSVKNLQPENLWLLQDGHCFKNQVINYCSLPQQTSKLGKVQFAGGNIETLRYLVKKTKSYTLVPYLFSEGLDSSEKKAMIRPFTGVTPTREVSFVFRRDQWKKSLLDVFVETVKKSIPAKLVSQKKGKRLSIDA
jgi:LysR family hydrogen peroxide-inducible transcriptional activator